MKRVFITLTFLFALGSRTAFSQPAALPDLSADFQVVRSDGHISAKGKLYLSKVGMHMQAQMPGVPPSPIYISRVDKNILWVLSPDKTYGELPLPFNPIIRTEIPKGSTLNCSAGETVDGHPTDKCVVNAEVRGQKVSTTFWKAKDLNDIAIRTLGASGDSTELKNIAIAPQSPSLFEVPSDYKKIP